MKMLIGTLAYLTAVSIVVATMFLPVPWPVSTVCVIMLCLGALWAWSDPSAKPCACQPEKPKRATADDVR